MAYLDIQDDQAILVPRVYLAGTVFILVTIGALLASNRGEALAAWNGTYVKIVTMTFAIAWLMENRRTLPWPREYSF
ncbi:hypothetical protein PCI56_02890 [Plesiomonas shigelloides subsp. oncorhynchi]|nr:hypothetical protein [Plesiomonas shigelloides]